jgi:dTDP-4-dehydrorhamnose 3,5-epimerase
VIFAPTPLAGVLVIEPELKADERGSFARLWCKQEFHAQGIDVEIMQASVSHNRRAGTLRGMHFAWPPAHEGKLVRCERGAILDVVIDLRPDSPGFLKHASFELDDRNRRAVYIPPGLAHGFQTLRDDTDVFYMMTDPYRADLADGVRFDDPIFGIRWPLPISVVADRDRNYPDFDRQAFTRRLAHQRATQRV